MTVKIARLELENVKKIRAVALTPKENGLTVIGGKNGQGKTSVLDAITWGLAGEKYRPRNAQNDNSVLPPSIHIELSNGLIVERKGKNSDLKITDPERRRTGQQILNALIGDMALNLPKFMAASDKAKADYMLKALGIDTTLTGLEKERAKVYSDRTLVGREAKRLQEYANSLPHYPDMGTQDLSADSLIAQLSAIQQRNNAITAAQVKWKENEIRRQQAHAQMDQLKAQIEALDAENGRLLATAQGQMESTDDLNQQLADLQQANAKIAANRTREQAALEARASRAEYDKLTAQLADIDERKNVLLEGAHMPLPELTVIDGILTYKGQPWDCMSGSEQLKVATAIVRLLNPECGFVLLDKLEQMDQDTLAEFGAWLESEGLQAIATRVSTGDECSIIITDGTATYNEPEVNPSTPTPEPETKAQDDNPWGKWSVK